MQNSSECHAQLSKFLSKAIENLQTLSKECVGAYETCKCMIGWKQIEWENFMNPNKMTQTLSLTHTQSSTYYPQSTH